MKAAYANYMAGVASIEGLGDDQLPGDLDNAKKALTYLDNALKEAKDIVSKDDSGILASIKSKVTGVNIDALKGEAKMLENSTSRMHKVFDGFDGTTPHSKIVSFIQDANAMSDLTVLKESSSRNSLGKLASEVSSGTIQDLADKSKTLTKSIWDAIPLPYKIGGGIAAVGLVLWKTC